MTRRRFSLLAAALFPSPGHGLTAEPRGLLEEIRQRHGVPALAGGVVTRDGLQEGFVTGVRKAGGRTPATTADLWHLGSMTKAMTGTLLATFVAQGRVKWDDTLDTLLPDLMAGAVPSARRITLRHLLLHRSGLPANRAQWGALPLPGDRQGIVRLECARPLLSEPGDRFLYSNLGYMIAGVVAERLSGSLWEVAMTRRVFEPLKMAAGFGGTGTPGFEDQPWPHGENGRPLPVNGPSMDNPPSLGPAGTCHASLADYAVFAADHLRGAAGLSSLLPGPLYRDLQTPAAGGDYAMGWHVMERDWAGGRVLTHNGTNTMNYFVAWLAPARGFGVIAACNQGGTAPARACDGVCSLLISRFGKSGGALIQPAKAPVK